tara:strand:- start:166 stop:420 length:255 start_codon:yes stop_codon:yes gene_type:complete
MDLDVIINFHDPEVSILKSDVWDRLDKMALEIETSSPTALNLLRQVRDCCLYDEDDGQIGVTEDAVIPSKLFDGICNEIKNSKQ